MIEAGTSVTVWISVPNGQPMRRTGKTIIDRWAGYAEDNIEIVNSSGAVIIPGNRIILVEEEAERNYDAL